MNIEIHQRDINKSANYYRKQGLIPGIIYGPDIQSTPIVIEEKVAINNFKFIHQRFNIIFKNKKYLGILQEIQKDPINLKPIHFDIYIPSLTRTITTTIPVVFKGEDEILRKGWFLNKSVTELEIEALVENLPESLEIDVSNLNIGQSIYVRDLNLPNIKILLDENTPLVSVIEEEITEETSKEDVNLSESSDNI
jgi:large subunit ribosomal protein L25